MKQEPEGSADFILGSGEMASLIRRTDWSRTPLGPMASWPQSLRTSVSLCLASNLPVNIVWGPEHTQIYNDVYRAVCGDKHPRALGQAYDVTWASIWPAVGEAFARALAGEGSCVENQRMFLTRNGFLEETFFTFSLSPIRAEDGSVGGVFQPVIETTATVLAERRTRALRDLGSALDVLTESHRLAATVMQALQPFAFDLPIVLIYELDAQGQCYALTAQQGLSTPAHGELARFAVDADGPWGTREMLRTQDMRLLDTLPASLAAQACGPYAEAPTRAVLLPIVRPGRAPAPMLLVVAPSPRLPFDEGYRGFLQLLASSVAGLLRSVRPAGELAAVPRADEARKLEALGRITGGVAHDFNNLMMIIAGGISVLERQPDAARQRQALDGMRRMVERGSELTRQLLTLGSSKPPAPQPMDLRACIDGIQKLLDRTLGGQVRVVSHHAPGLWPVLADASELELALLDLGVNAREAMPAGGTVSITAENVRNPPGQPAGDFVRLCIGDTGAGTAPGARQTVTLLLPRSPEPVPAPPPSIAVPAPLRVAVAHRVLVVEDDTEVAELVAEMLEFLGYQTVRAISADEALFTLEHDSRIDLVFSDVMMPGTLNGVELARRMRRDRPDLPVILTTGYAESFRQEAHNEGLLLLPKPYAIEELGALMERAFHAKVH